MKNPNNLKTFNFVIFGGSPIAIKAGDDNGAGTYQSPPFNPNSSTAYCESTGIFPVTYNKAKLNTTIQVIDINGNPLVSAHVKWSVGGTITDANGEATINVFSENTQVSISYVGKRTHIAPFSGLVNAMVTLQENVSNLPPVVVGTKPTTTNTTVDPSKNKKMLITVAIGVGVIFLISALSSKGKKGSAKTAIGLGATKSKKRKSTKKSKGLREPAAEITL